MNEQKEEKIVLPKDLSTELAKVRTGAAYDRTLMAWIRTALSLIGFGIGIFEYTEKTGGDTIFKSSKLVGLSMVILGIVASFMAIRENQKNHTQLLNSEISYKGKSTLSKGIGYALIVIGLMAVIHILMKTFQTGG
jgi:putative membrane protein